jgi:hypothetical protein
MKLVSPTIGDRLRKGAPVGVTVGVTVLAVAGVVSTILQITGWISLSVVAAVSVLCGIIAAYVRGRFSYIPQMMVDEIGRDNPCYCRRVTSDDLRHACELTKPYYGEEYVDFSVAEKWRKKNPEAFVQIVNERGEMCSCFGFIAIKDSCFDEFIKGRVKDGEFDEDDILDTEETRNASRLYLSGVIVSGAGSWLGGKRANMMAWAILTYYRKYFALRRARTIYALAVTKEGDAFLKAFGFKLVSGAAQRRDRCNLYKSEMDRSAWDAMARKVPDWSRSCVMEAA